MRMFIVMLMLLIAPPSLAQIQAKHDETGEVTEIASPMLLDVPFPIQNPELWERNKTKVFSKDLLKFSCEGVSIVSLTVQFDTPRNGMVPLSIIAFMRNRPGHDKLVQLRFQVYRDGAPISGGERLVNVDVEEGRAARRDFKLLVKEDALRREGPDPVLNIRMEAKDH